MHVSGEKIKKQRKQLGLTQVELAEKLHITQGTLAQYETERRKPKFETLKKIADVLCVPWTSLCDDVEDEVYGKVVDEYAKKLWAKLDDISPEDLTSSSVDLAKVFNVKKSPYIEMCLEDIRNALQCLNKTGQQEAVKRVKELTAIPAYQKEADPDKK